LNVTNENNHKSGKNKRKEFSTFRPSVGANYS